MEFIEALEVNGKEKVKYNIQHSGFLQWFIKTPNFQLNLGV